MFGYVPRLMKHLTHISPFRVFHPHTNIRISVRWIISRGTWPGMIPIPCKKWRYWHGGGRGVENNQNGSLNHGAGNKSYFRSQKYKCWSNIETILVGKGKGEGEAG